MTFDDDITLDDARYALCELENLAGELHNPEAAWELFWALTKLVFTQSSGPSPTLAEGLWYAAKEVSWDIIALR